MKEREIKELLEAYASVYANQNVENLDEEPSLGATKSAMAAQRSAQNAAGMRGSELTHGAKPGGSPKPAGSATAGSSVTQPRSREFSHGTRKLKDVVKGGLTMSYELEGDQIDEIKTATTTSGDRIPDFENDTKAKQVPGLRVNKPQKPVEEGYKSPNKKRIERQSAGAYRTERSALNRGDADEAMRQNRRRNAMNSPQTRRNELESKNRKEELNVDVFDYLLEYLVAEGYADTNQSALAIMANMSEEWREGIVEMMGGVGGMGRMNFSMSRTSGASPRPSGTPTSNRPNTRPTNTDNTSKERIKFSNPLLSRPSSTIR